MKKWLNRRASLAVVASAALVMGVAGPASASDLDLPAGLACEFALGIDFGDGGPRNEHEFTDKDGNVVGVLSAGRGNDLTFTNLATGATLSLEASGAPSRTVTNADGSLTTTLLGHNVLILFPTDVPAGPSTTLHVGRVVYHVATDGVFTLLSAVGTQTDICAALSD